MSDMKKIEGTKVPDVTFKTRAQDDSGDYQWKDVTSSNLFDGKRTVVFGLPGAFTPTCSSTHLPGYETRYDDLKAQGIDEVYCVSVNDAFVMNAWAKDQGIKNVKVIPDGNGEFSEGLGMLVEKKNLGFGNRCWRYAMVVSDGTVEKFFAEPGREDNHGDDPFEVSDADTMLTYLDGKE